MLERFENGKFALSRHFVGQAREPPFLRHAACGRTGARRSQSSRGQKGQPSSASSQHKHDRRRVTTHVCPRRVERDEGTAAEIESDGDNPHRRKVGLKSTELVGVGRINDSSSTQRCRSHHRGVDDRRAPYCRERLTGRTTQGWGHTLERHRRKNLLSNIGAPPPPFGAHDCGHDGKISALGDGPERRECTLPAPLERNQHPCVEGESQAALLRGFFAGPVPRHSRAISSRASSSSGGTPYLSKNRSAAANFASRVAISASKAETLPPCRRCARAFRSRRVCGSNEKLVVFVFPGLIMAV